jgi:hypothetical protein
MRSRCSLVDILGEDRERPVECQGECVTRLASSAGDGDTAGAGWKGSRQDSGKLERICKVGRARHRAAGSIPMTLSRGHRKNIQGSSKRRSEACEPVSKCDRKCERVTTAHRLSAVGREPWFSDGSHPFQGKIFLKQLAEFFAGAVELGFGSSDGPIHDPGNFLMLIALNVMKFDDHFLPWGQAIERSLQAQAIKRTGEAQIGSSETFVEIGATVVVLGGRLGGELRTNLFPKAHEDRIYRDAMQPGVEG